ncbi:hypothetical protein [Fulvivirga sp.]|uniref:hypothetical protein n=1 Tax=Fulvivirga sp. TaxID=1931237 RepID=UPI0032EE2B74
MKKEEVINEEIDTDLAHHLIEIEERDPSNEPVHFPNPFGFEGERGSIHVGDNIFHSCVLMRSSSRNT